MATDSETGIAVNMVNFDELNLKVSGFGPKYNPSNPTITASALNALSGDAKGAVETTARAFAARTRAASSREEAFGPLGPLVTQVINALVACGISQPLIDSAMTFVRKLRGRRVTPFLSEEEKAALAAEGKDVKQVSASQMGYDTRIENFGKLIDLIETIPEYAPNEEELQTRSLRALYTSLKAKNADVLAADVALEDAYARRNALFNAETTGMLDVVETVKKYVKSVFKASGAEYQSISGIKFSPVK